MPVLERAGVKLHFNTQGKGREVLFVHDVLGRAVHFSAVVESMEVALRTILPDLRGHGASRKCEPGWTFGEWVEDVRAIAREACADKPLVVGHGLGGAIAATWALEHPEEIESLVLVAPQLNLVDAHRKALMDLASTVGDQRPSEEGVAHFVNAWFSLGWREAHQKTVAAEIKRIASISVAVFNSCITAFLQAEDLSNRLDAFSCPTRILCGGMDNLAPASLVCPHPPGGILRMVQDSGHMIPLERPTDIVEEISAMAGLF